MYSLLIDTHFVTNICLYRDNKLLDILRSEEQRQSTIIMPLINQILHNNNIKPENLNALIVVNGPGSFTGVRLGVTIGKILSYSLKIPVKTINSLELLAILDDFKNDTYGIYDAKGCYIGRTVNNKVIVSYEQKSNLQNENIISELKDNFDNLFNYEYMLKKSDCFNIKPIYIKQIEALK